MLQRTDELLKRLVASNVEFVIIGGVAAIAHGAATVTVDFDITAPFTVDNLRRLMSAVGDLHPRYVMTPQRRPVVETPEQLASNRNLYLATDLGRLDVLGEVAPIGRYDAVAAHAERVEVLGVSCRIISLDDLIASKHHLGRDKDRLVEKELRAIREARARRG